MTERHDWVETAHMSSSKCRHKGGCQVRQRNEEDYQGRANDTAKQVLFKVFFVLIALKATLPTSNARSETSASRSTRM
jgi:hypothetical protein